MPEQDKNSQPIYFLDLIVENVRCFGEKQVLDLSDGNGKPALWTVILGDNGTGKTTLLKCLAGLEIRDVISDDYDYSKDDYDYMGWVDYAISLRDDIKDYFKKTNYFTINLSYYIGSIKFNGSIRKNLLFKKINTSFIESASIFNEYLVYTYGASRRIGTGSLSETQNSDPTASLFSEDVSLINAEEWLLQADYAAKSGTDENKAYFERRFDKTKQLLIELLPDVKDIQIRPITKEQPKPAIQIKTPYGWIGIKDLSLGYQTLMAWMVDLASRMFDRYPDSDNPLAEPAIVLVDEIDLHLHPKWQRTIMSHLSNIFKQTQFIVTAHSPLIVQSAQNANIVLLKREGDEVVIKQEDKDIRGWRVDQLLASDMFGISTYPDETEKLLKTRRKILSKGKLSRADKKLLKETESRIGYLPTAESPMDIEAMEIIRKAAEQLKQKQVQSL